MIDELLRLTTIADNSEFKPNIFSGEFDWDYENKKFIPENGQRRKMLEDLIEKIEKSHIYNVEKEN